MTSGKWADSDRRDYLPPDWWKIRQERLDLDGGRCTFKLPRSGKRCPRPATDVDHTGARDDHRLEKLRSLCGDHHKKVTAKQAFAGRQRRKAQKRQEEAPPGRVR